MLGTDTALNETSGDAEGETSSCATKMRDVERRGLSSHSGKGMFNDAYLVWSGDLRSACRTSGDIPESVSILKKKRRSLDGAVSTERRRTSCSSPKGAPPGKTGIRSGRWPMDRGEGNVAVRGEQVASVRLVQGRHQSIHITYPPCRHGTSPGTTHCEWAISTSHGGVVVVLGGDRMDWIDLRERHEAVSDWSK